MEHTKKLLKELHRREIKNPIGEPITDTDFDIAYKEIEDAIKLKRNQPIIFVMSLVIFVMILIYQLNLEL